MLKYVGSEYIILGCKKGIIIKDNSNIDRSENFEWDEVAHIFSKPKNTIHNSEYESALLKMFSDIPELSRGQVEFHISRFKQYLNQDKS